MTRCSIRRQYLTLLYGYPREADLNTFDQHWMQTTHSVIAKYRALPEMKIALNDPAAALAAAAAASTKSSSSRRAKGSGGGRKDDAAAAVSDPRPVLKEFASFLKGEIKQYKELVVRLAVSSGLTEVEDYLSLLHPGPDLIRVATDEPLGPLERERKVGMFVKGLIFLGDLERYREMYSPTRLGLADVAPRKRERRSNTAAKAAELSAEQQVSLPHDAEFKDARQYYDTARLIQPENGTACLLIDRPQLARILTICLHLLAHLAGNPFNQLATIDNYRSDRFGATYHWLRALAVKEPFTTARGNLQATLKGPLRTHLEREPAAGTLALERALEKDIIVLLAMLVLRAGFDETFVEATLGRLSALIRNCVLSKEVVLRTFVSLCAIHWDARLVRPTPRSSDARGKSKVDAELRTLETILGLVTALLAAAADALISSLSPRQQATLDSGAAVLDTAETAAAGERLDNFSRYLTAVLRQTLPTLRVAFKWIHAHQDYLTRVVQRQESGSAVAARSQLMFAAYVRFANALAYVFSAIDPGILEGSLEEDLELRGFGPLRKLFPASMSVAPAQQADGHSNGESFRRISDLQLDALLLAGMESSRVYIDGGRYALVPPATQKAPVKATAASRASASPSTPAAAVAAGTFGAAPFALGQVPQSAVSHAGNDSGEPAAFLPTADDGHASPDATAEVTYLPATHASSADVSDELNFADMDLEDDPVDAAMRAALADSDDFDSDAEAQLGMTLNGWGEVEERILWPPASARKAAAARACVST